MKIRFKVFMRIYILFLLAGLLITGYAMERDASSDNIQVEADNIEYNHARQQLYCRGNVKIFTTRGTIFAQKALIDFSVQEIYAGTEVRFERKDASEYRVEYLRYNYEFDYLYAEELRGQEQFLRFAMAEVYSHSQEEISGRDGWLTPCTLPHPPFRVKSREMEIYMNQRVYMRGAKLCIHHTPVFYLPVYSRNLAEKSPWSVSAGYASKKGGIFKVSYLYRHRYYADQRNQTRLSRWNLLLSGQHFTQRGTGILSKGRIEVLDEFWQGKFSGFYIEDDQYDISRRKHKDLIEERYAYDIDRYSLSSYNRFELPNDWLWFINFEIYSDPDIYQDFIGSHYLEELKTQRGVESVFSRVFDDHYFSLSTRYRERLTQSTYRDNYKHWSDDRDFDGIDYHRSQLHLPVATLERQYLPLTEFLMYKYKVDFFNVLDPGLMPQSAADEKWMTGTMVDNALFFNYFLTPRLSVNSESGLKTGYVQYNKDEFGDERFYQIAHGTGQWLSADIVDKAYNQVDSSQVSIYSLNTLHYLIADNLRIYNFYAHNYNFGYTSGDFYHETANKLYKEIYPFPIETQVVGGGFEHSWDSPNYRWSFEFGENLRDELFARETIRYARSNISLQNSANTFTIFTGPQWKKMNDLLVLFPDGLDQPAEYHDFQRDIYTLYTGFKSRYGNRWNMSLIYNTSWEKEDHPLKPDDHRILDQVYSHIQASLGLKISDKYSMNSHAHYDTEEKDLQYISIGLNRRIPCLYIGMNVQMHQNLDEFSRDYGDKEYRYTFYLEFQRIPGVGFHTGDIAGSFEHSADRIRRMETISR